jgi:hypothetical protein
MKEITSHKKQPYTAPETLCLALSAKTAILTVSGGINDEPWGD